MFDYDGESVGCEGTSWDGEVIKRGCEWGGEVGLLIRARRMES